MLNYTQAQDTITTHCPCISQELVLLLLQHDRTSQLNASRTWVQQMVDTLDAVREDVWSAVSQMGTVKTYGAFYFLVPLPEEVSGFTCNYTRSSGSWNSSLSDPAITVLCAPFLPAPHPLSQRVISMWFRRWKKRRLWSYLSTSSRCSSCQALLSGRHVISACHMGTSHHPRFLTPYNLCIWAVSIF